MHVRFISTIRIASRVLGIGLLATALSVVAGPPSPTHAASPQTGPSFSDVAGHWAEAAITRAAQAGYVTGYPDGTFRPDKPVTRAEAVTLVVNALVAAQRVTPVPVGEMVEPPFTDVRGHWSVRQGPLALAWASGLIQYDDARVTDQGSAPDRFEPDRPATRLDVAVWLVRAVQPALEAYVAARRSRSDGGWSDEARRAVALALEDRPWPFNDSVPAEQRLYVLAAVESGLVTGFPDGRFGGEEPVTRAELVQMLQRWQPLADLNTAGVERTPPALPAHPVHGPVQVARVVSTYHGMPVPRPLRADRPADWPGLARLVNAIATAKEDVPPPGVGLPPVAPPHVTYLEVRYADGTIETLDWAVRCENAPEGGMHCDREPGWLIRDKFSLIRSRELWEYMSGQMNLDMPLIRQAP